MSDLKQNTNTGEQDSARKAAREITDCCRKALRHWPSVESDWATIENSFAVIIQAAITAAALAKVKEGK